MKTYQHPRLKKITPLKLWELTREQRQRTRQRDKPAAHISHDLDIFISYYLIGALIHASKYTNTTTDFLRELKASKLMKLIDQLEVKANTA